MAAAFIHLAAAADRLAEVSAVATGATVVVPGSTIVVIAGASARVETATLRMALHPEARPLHCGIAASPPGRRTDSIGGIAD